MKFRPLHDRVVVKRIEAEQKTAGGIIIPDTAKEKPQQGEVIAVGPGGRDETGKLIPIDLQTGDRVLFGKWSGTEVKIDGIEYLIMKESDVMGVLVEASASRKVASSPPTVTGKKEGIVREKEHGCQGSQILGRRPREDAAWRRHARQCGESHARSERTKRRS
jgi:chaperonin GroES